MSTKSWWQLIFWRCSQIAAILPVRVLMTVSFQVILIDTGEGINVPEKYAFMLPINLLVSDIPPLCQRVHLDADPELLKLGRWTSISGQRFKEFIALNKEGIYCVQQSSQPLILNDYAQVRFPKGKLESKFENILQLVSSLCRACSTMRYRASGTLLITGRPSLASPRKTGRTFWTCWLPLRWTYSTKMNARMSMSLFSKTLTRFCFRSYIVSFYQAYQ